MSVFRAFSKIFIDKSMNKLLIDKSINLKQSMRLCSMVSPESTFTYRTHSCGELNAKHVGKEVVLCGWLQFQRLDKFAILRDAYGSIQVIIPEERIDLMKLMNESSLECVVCVHGEVVNRPSSQVNQKMSTGEVEILASDYKILNNVETDLSFSIRDYNKAKESTRLRYRYLDLRFPEMQRNLRLRSKVIFNMRKHLISKGFIEVETPTLFKRTLGGAQEYIVPTEYPGEFYALVQSPQQLKQLLMVGGVDRYFQVARCYRNEGARPDRQPEFSQLDIEMSFTREEGVMGLVEELVRETWPHNEIGNLPSGPFPRMTLNHAIQHYGTDKPNTSSPAKINKINEEVLNSASDIFNDSNPRVLHIPKASELLSNSLKKYIEEVRRKHYSQTRLYSWKITENVENLKDSLVKNKLEFDHNKFISSFNLDPGDLLFLAVGQNENLVLELLGKVRIEIIKNIPCENKWNILWVTDFPLFDLNDDGSLGSMHHPFTQPHPDDLHLLTTDPLKVRGLHYDLVLNGWEIAGGSVRIHSASLQEKILSMLNIDSSGLKHMLEALDSGAPPHAGIAFGLDRYISLMVQAPSIRDVIAFPKTSEGRDLMSLSPSAVTQEELDLYKISINEKAFTKPQIKLN